MECYLKVTSGHKGTKNWEESDFFLHRSPIICCYSRFPPSNESTLCIFFDLLQPEGKIYSHNTRKTVEMWQFLLVFCREPRECSEILPSFGFLFHGMNRTTIWYCE